MTIKTGSNHVQLKDGRWLVVRVVSSDIHGVSEVFTIARVGGLNEYGVFKYDKVCVGCSNIHKRETLRKYGVSDEEIDTVLAGVVLA
jgi:hypothetical protein